MAVNIQHIALYCIASSWVRVVLDSGFYFFCQRSSLFGLVGFLLLAVPISQTNSRQTY